MSSIKVTVDAIIFGYEPDEGVSVILISRKFSPFQGDWALPGGFVGVDESLEAAVKRELSEETGIHVNFLEQLYTFGKPNRDPRKRVISVAYYGLVRPKDYQLLAQSDAQDVAWFNIKKLPKLAFDHRQILDMAIRRLRGKLAYEPVGFELLDKKFAFSDLEKLYQTLLDQELDRRNFKKKIMAYGFVEELNETIQRALGRPARLYQFNRSKYFELKERGFNFDLFI